MIKRELATYVPIRKIMFPRRCRVFRLVADVVEDIDSNNQPKYMNKPYPSGQTSGSFLTKLDVVLEPLSQYRHQTSR